MQRLALVLVLVFLPALLLGKTSATVYYLDSSVATDGDGTTGNPFKNIATAFQVLQQNLSQATTGVTLVLNIAGTLIYLFLMYFGLTALSRGGLLDSLFRPRRYGIFGCVFYSRADGWSPCGPDLSNELFHVISRRRKQLFKPNRVLHSVKCSSRGVSRYATWHYIMDWKIHLYSAALLLRYLSNVQLNNVQVSNSNYTSPSIGGPLLFDSNAQFTIQESVFSNCKCSTCRSNQLGIITVVTSSVTFHNNTIQNTQILNFDTAGSAVLRIEDDLQIISSEIAYTTTGKLFVHPATSFHLYSLSALGHQPVLNVFNTLPGKNQQVSIQSTSIHNNYGAIIFTGSAYSDTSTF